MHEHESRQLLHLVFGGEVEAPESITFKDLSRLDIVGIFPNYKEAYSAWRAAAIFLRVDSSRAIIQHAIEILRHE